YTFFTTAEAIWRLGAKLVFVDIDPVTYNIAPTRITASITSRTRAIVPVHLFGQAVEMEPILKIAEKHGLKILEDSAQSILAEYRGRRTGSLGDAAGFSFYPSFLVISGWRIGRRPRSSPSTLSIPRKDTGG
ncbi:MAG: DegT/DnrJ/EryC1/StrS family aminotransferase, partial [Isosphaerales bacterium]